MNWEELRAAIARKWVDAKLPEAILPELVERYVNSSGSDRLSFDDALRRWLRSDDAATRFDALSLIEAMSLSQFEPELIRLQEGLRVANGPEAQSELAWASRILERL